MAGASIIELSGEAPRSPTWPTLDPAALHGLPGEVVQAIGPHTEADPVAIVAQYLIAAGNAIGRGDAPHPGAATARRKGSVRPSRQR